MDSCYKTITIPSFPQQFEPTYPEIIENVREAVQKKMEEEEEGLKNEPKQKVVMIKYQIQIHKYKYKYTNTNTNSHIQIQIQIQEGLRSQILTFFQKIKVSTKTAISLEPLDLHPLNTTQIEALGVLDLKNTSGGL